VYSLSEGSTDVPRPRARKEKARALATARAAAKSRRSRGARPTTKMEGEAQSKRRNLHLRAGRRRRRRTRPDCCLLSPLTGARATFCAQRSRAPPLPGRSLVALFAQPARALLSTNLVAPLTPSLSRRRTVGGLDGGPIWPVRNTRSLARSRGPLRHRGGTKVEFTTSLTLKSRCP